MAVRPEIIEGQDAPPQFPPHQGAAMFALRDQSRGFDGLIDVIEREEGDIATASEELLRLRYSNEGAYVLSLVFRVGEGVSDYSDYPHAEIVNRAIRPAVENRAKELGIKIHPTS